MATLDNFLQACGSDRYVQVIAHGFLDEQNPGLSCIAFAQKEAQLDEYNLLMLNDLYAMTLPQELIGFSACRTASGQYREGEGNMSLARGLAYAGVRSFTTTLWDIPTDGVAEIMPAFFKSLLSGRKPLPKDLALAEAKRAYLESATLDAALHPANWAGVVLIGATDVNAPGRSPRPEWLVLAAIATILGGRYLAGRFRKVNSPKGG
jgi:CHAT domain-containing protein